MKKSNSLVVPGISFSHVVTDGASGVVVNNRHIHDLYEILYVANGKGRYIIEGSEFELKPRTLILIKPFKYHYVEIDYSEPYDRCVINFSISSVLKDAVPMLEKLAASSDEESGTFFAPDALPQYTLSIFDRFEMLGALPDQERSVCAKMLLSELVVMLSASASSKISHDTDALGARVIMYVNDRLDKDVSLEAVARKFFVSKYYLCRAFKKYSGVSLHSYINHKRVMYAKQLIEAGETAAMAAYKVGFGDYSAFYRTHIKILGVPPTLQTKRRSVKPNSQKGKQDQK